MMCFLFEIKVLSFLQQKGESSIGMTTLFCSKRRQHHNTSVKLLVSVSPHSRWVMVSNCWRVTFLPLIKTIISTLSAQLMHSCVNTNGGQQMSIGGEIGKASHVDFPWENNGQIKFIGPDII